MCRLAGFRYNRNIRSNSDTTPRALFSMSLLYPVESQTLIAAGAAIVGTLAVFTIYNNSPARLAERAGAKLPPGPKQTLIIGNLLNFPRVRWFDTFSNDWKRQYGDIIYVNLAGKPLIVLNSLDAAVELMDKRMNMYSFRPYKAMVNDLMDAGWSMVVANPGHRFYEQRKIFRRAIGASSVIECDGFISYQIEPLLQALQGTPQDVFQVLMR